VGAEPPPEPPRRRRGDAGRRGAGIVDGLAGALERTDGVELAYETEAVQLCAARDGRVDGSSLAGETGCCDGSARERS
jgi:hypothetical protein